MKKALGAFALTILLLFGVYAVVESQWPPIYPMYWALGDLRDVTKPTAASDGLALVYTASTKIWAAAAPAPASHEHSALDDLASIRASAAGNVALFGSATTGETRAFTVSGYKSGDSLQTLSIAVGSVANDTATITGLSNYTFDGNLAAAAFDVPSAVVQAYKAEYNIGSQLGAWVHGVKVEATRNADIQPSTGCWFGGQFVLNAGSSGYTALDKPAYVLQAVFKGSDTSPNGTDIHVGRFETQSAGKVSDIVHILANTGTTITGSLAYLATHVAPSVAMLSLNARSGVTVPIGIKILDSEASSYNYGIDMDSATINTADIRLGYGETIKNTVDGTIDFGAANLATTGTWGAIISTSSLDVNSAGATGETGVDFNSINSTFSTIAQSDAEGIANKSDLRIGLDDDNPTLILLTRDDIMDDLGLSAATRPTFYLANAAASRFLKFEESGITVSSTLGTFGFDTSATIRFRSQADSSAGNKFEFTSLADKELTDSNGQQAWMYIEPKVLQTGTAAFDGLYINIDGTVTDTYGDGSTGDGNNLLRLADNGTTRFKVSTDGEVTQTLTDSADSYHAPYTLEWTATSAMAAGGSQGIYSICNPVKDVQNAYSLRGRMDLRDASATVDVNQLHAVDALINFNTSHVYDLVDNISVIGAAVHGAGADITNVGGEGNLNIFYGVWGPTATQNFTAETNGMLLMSHASTYLDYGVQVQNSGAMTAGLYLLNHSSNSPATMTSGILMESASAKMTYGINMTGASISTADILLQNGESIDNITDGAIDFNTARLTGIVTATFTSEYANTSSSNAVTIACDNGQKQKLTLDENTTVTLTPPTSGIGNFLLRVIQDGTGGRVITWPTVYAPDDDSDDDGDLDPDTHAGTVCIYNIYYNGTSWYIVLANDFEVLS